VGWEPPLTPQKTYSAAAAAAATAVFDGVTYYDRWIKPTEGLNAGTV